MARHYSYPVLAALGLTTTLVLSSCAHPHANDSTDIKHVSFAPAGEVSLSGDHNWLKKVHSAELTKDGDILTASFGDNYGTLVINKTNVETGKTEELRSITIAVNKKADNLTKDLEPKIIADRTDEEIATMAKNIATIDAQVQAESANTNNPDEASHIDPNTVEPQQDNIDLYTAVLNLARDRARQGIGITQLYNADTHSRDTAATWIVNSNLAALLDIDRNQDTPGLSEDDKNNLSTNLTRPVMGLEGAAGTCAIANVIKGSGADSQNIETTTDDHTTLTQESSSVVTSSGTGTLVTRGSNHLQEIGLIDATIPLGQSVAGIDGAEISNNTKSATLSGAKTHTLLGLSELDCATSPQKPALSSKVGDGIGIFAAVNTNLAKRAMDHRKIIDKIDAADVDIENETVTPKSPEEKLSVDNPEFSPHVPTEAGHVVVLSATDGVIHADIDSHDMIKKYPQLEGKNISSIAVDEITYDHALSTGKGGSWWQKLPPGLKRAKKKEQDVTAYLTYEGDNTIYKVNVKI